MAVHVCVFPETKDPELVEPLFPWELKFGFSCAWEALTFLVRATILCFTSIVLIPLLTADFGRPLGFPVSTPVIPKHCGRFGALLFLLAGIPMIFMWSWSLHILLIFTLLASYFPWSPYLWESEYEEYPKRIGAGVRSSLLVIEHCDRRASALPKNVISNNSSNNSVPNTITRGSFIPLTTHSPPFIKASIRRKLMK